MSEPVIIGCGSEYGIECGACGWTGALSMGHKCSGYHPDSLVALKVAVVDAFMFHGGPGALPAFDAALAALRAHPDYVTPEDAP